MFHDEKATVGPIERQLSILYGRISNSAHGLTITRGVGTGTLPGAPGPCMMNLEGY